MNHYCKTSNIAPTHIQSESVESIPLSRRKFISLLTAGATSAALQACGGGANSSAGGAALATAPPPMTTTPAPVPAPTPTAPASTSASVIAPDLTFVEGIKSSVSAAPWISGADPAAVVLSLNSVALPAGVTYNSTTKTFDYDGIGAPTTASGYVLTAVGG